jgi:hypothetical protein
MMKKNLTILFILSSFLYSCKNMEKEVDLNLPEYESKMVVECYLEPGEKYRLSLFESVSYFEEPTLPSVDSALVIITHNNIKDTLFFNPYYDPATGKFYNYISIDSVPIDYTSDFFLEIEDRRGRMATAQTKILTPVLIDTVIFKYDDDSLAYPETRVMDNTSTSDYYRYQVTRDNLQGSSTQDFHFSDQVIKSSEISLGSDYELKKNDVVIITFYHIDKAYFDFLESVTSAIDANGNPFGQPSVIKSNINGGMGIFTGLSYDRKTLTTP